MVTQPPPPPVELRQPAPDHSANLSVRLDALKQAVEVGTGQVRVNVPAQTNQQEMRQLEARINTILTNKFGSRGQSAQDVQLLTENLMRQAAVDPNFGQKLAVLEKYDFGVSVDSRGNVVADGMTNYSYTFLVSPQNLATQNYSVMDNALSGLRNKAGDTLADIYYAREIGGYQKLHRNLTSLDAASRLLNVPFDRFENHNNRMTTHDFFNLRIADKSVEKLLQAGVPLDEMDRLSAAYDKNEFGLIEEVIKPRLEQHGLKLEDIREEVRAEIEAMRKASPAIAAPAPAAAPQSAPRVAPAPAASATPALSSAPPAAVVVQPTAVNAVSSIADFKNIDFKARLGVNVAGNDGAQSTATQMLDYIRGELMNYHTPGSNQPESLTKMNDYVSRMDDGYKALGVEYINRYAQAIQNKTPLPKINEFKDAVVSLRKGEPLAAVAATLYPAPKVAPAPRAIAQAGPPLAEQKLTPGQMQSMRLSQNPVPQEMHNKAQAISGMITSSSRRDHTQLNELVEQFEDVNPAYYGLLKTQQADPKVNIQDGLDKVLMASTATAAVLPVQAQVRTSGQQPAPTPQKTPQQLYEAAGAAPVVANGKPVTVQMANGEKRALWVERHANNDPDYVLKTNDELVAVVVNALKSTAGKPGAEDILKSMTQYQALAGKEIVSRDPATFKYNDPNAPAAVKAGVERSLNHNEGAAETAESGIRNVTSPINLPRPGA